MRTRDSDQSSSLAAGLRRSTRRSSQSGINKGPDGDRVAPQSSPSDEAVRKGSDDNERSHRSSLSSLTGYSDAENDQSNGQSVKESQSVDGLQTQEEQDVDNTDGKLENRKMSSAMSATDTISRGMVHDHDMEDTSLGELHNSSNESPSVGSKGAILGKRKRKTSATDAVETLDLSRESASGDMLKDTQNRIQEVAPSVLKNVAGGILKRLPGRRRAPHADAQMEAKLRRQLELKVAYRAVAKAQKLILAELARRTAEELEAKPESYKDYDEFEDVTEELQSRLNARMETLRSYREEEEARLERIKHAQELIVRGKFQQKVVDSQDDRLLQAQHELLTTFRSSTKEGDSEATDDEDGIIPRLYTVRAPAYERKPLPDAYDSRSRFFVRTQRLWDDLESRFKMRIAQHYFDPSSLVAKPKDFVTFDWAHRDMATAAWNMDVLIDAAKEVDAQTAKANLDRDRDAAATLQAFAAQRPPVPMKIETPKRAKQSGQPIVVKEPSSDGRQPHYINTPGFGTTPSSGKSQAIRPTLRAEEIYMVGGRSLFAHMDTRTSVVPQPSHYPFSAVANGRPHATDQGLAISAFRHNSLVQPDYMELPPQRSSEHASTMEPHRGMPPQRGPDSEHFTVPQNPKAEPTGMAHILNAAPVKPRTRPGPKAVYASTGGHRTPSMQKHWSPFINSMGPPMYSTPKYMQSNQEAPRRPSVSNPSGPPPFSHTYSQQLAPPLSFEGSAAQHDHQRRHSGGRPPSFQSIAPAQSQPGNSVQNQPMPQQQQALQLPAHLRPPENQAQSMPPPADAHRRDHDPFRPRYAQPPPFFHQQGPPRPQAQYMPFDPFPQRQNHQTQPQRSYPLGPQHTAQSQGHLMHGGQRVPDTTNARPPSPRHFLPRQPPGGPFTVSSQEPQSVPHVHRNSLTGYGTNFTGCRPIPRPDDVVRHDRDGKGNALPPHPPPPLQWQESQRPPQSYHQSFPAYTSRLFKTPPPLLPALSSQLPQQRTQRAFSSSKPSVASLLQTPQPPPPPSSSSSSQTPGQGRQGM